LNFFVLEAREVLALPNSSNVDMKRKLNEKDVPEPVKVERSADKTGFTDLGLDSRLLQAVTREKFTAPTPIQRQAIPIALQGKDILGRNGCCA